VEDGLALIEVDRLGYAEAAAWVGAQVLDAVLVAAEVEEARNRIINALIGIIILASMWAVMSLVARFVGLDWEALPIPTINGLIGGA
jgi:hypothetical protein